MIAKLKEKFEDKARLSRALVAYADNTDLTVEQIEANLAAEDQAAELVNLREQAGQVGKLKADLKAATARADKAEADYKALKDSGHHKEVDLGQGANGGSAALSNPWKSETRNYTEQARLSKENPELAKALKVEAGVAVDA